MRGTSFVTSATRFIGAGITFLGVLACIAWVEETRSPSLEETGAIELGPPTPTTASKVGSSLSARPARLIKILQPYDRSKHDA